MGLLSWLFGSKDKSESVIDDAITGAVIGGIVGELADNRTDRQEILGHLRLHTYREEGKIAAEELAQASKNCETIKYAAHAHCVWVDNGCEELYAKFMNNYLYDPAFAATQNKLNNRWNELRQRAIRVKIMPYMYMPRSICGDVAGGVRTLTLAMDKLEADVVICENQ